MEYIYGKSYAYNQDDDADETLDDEDEEDLDEGLEDERAPDDAEEV